MRLVSWMSLCVLLAGAAFGADSPPAPTQADLDKTVRELGDDQYKVREQAFGRLLEWAIANIDILKKLPASDPDPEIDKALEDLSRKVQEHTLDTRKAFYHRELIRLAGEDTKLKETLQRLLDKATSETVEAAQRSVAQKGEKALTASLVGYLTECLLAHDDPKVRCMAASALGQIGDRSVAPRLIELLEDAVPTVRHAATMALGGLGEKSAAPQIAKLLEDPYPRVRQRAALTLAQLNDKSMAPRIEKLLEDSDPAVLAGAVISLGNLGEKPVAPKIVKLLEYPDQRIRLVAVEALGKLGEKSVIPQVAKLLEDPDLYVRLKATAALWQLGDKSMMPRLLKFLEDAEPCARWTAAESLGHLGDKSVAPQIAKCLEDSNPNVRTFAALTLRTLSGEKWPGDKLEDSARAWWTQHKDDPEWRTQP